MFKHTLGGDTFLLYDSINDDNKNSRFLIFATKENLRMLFRSNTWFIDGKFKTAPTIFYQLFEILGSVTQEDKTLTLPFVYALLENKEQVSYKKIVDVVSTKAREFNIEINQPSVIMSDFELGIINAATILVGEDRVWACFFHLCKAYIDVYNQWIYKIVI